MKATQRLLMRGLPVITLMMLLGCASRAFGQWASPSPNPDNNIYYNGGNVGIGTTSPQVRLDTWTAARSTAYNPGDLTTWADQLVKNPTNSSGAATGIAFQLNDSYHPNAGTGIAVVRSDPGNDFQADLAFITRPYQAAAQERMRILSNGNVGIGTASPTSKLHVDANNTTAGEIASYFTTASFANIRGALLHGGNAGGYLSAGGLQLMAQGAANATSGSGDINFITSTVNSANNSTDATLALRMKIRYDGNVGIGTTSPQVRLDTWTAARSTAYNPGDLTTWADQLVKNPTNSSGAATGIAFQLNDSYHPNAGTGIAVVRSDPGNDFQADLAFITRPYQAAAQERMRILSNGNVGIGTTSTGSYKLNVNGDTNVAGNLNIVANGSSAGNIVAAGTIAAKYQDVAEWVPSSEQLSAGTVVVLDSTKSNQVTSSSVSYDTRVAGVVSAQPGLALGEKSDGKVLVATTGRVRVKVDASKGPIHIGDLLVTSDVPGMATKSEPIEFAGRKMHMPGTLIGKALEPLEKGRGEILVLLSLQ